MTKKSPEVLIISIVYPPNVGGVETHLGDLTNALSRQGWKAWVLTYTPITTNVSAPLKENHNGATVYRIPWPGGLFYKLLKNPLFEFLYLVPGLLLVTPFFLLFNSTVKVIHGQGLVGGFVAVVWGKVFGKRVIVSTHNIYGFPANGFYRNFAKWIFGSADYVMGLSRQSVKEIQSLGIDKNKVGTFTYWVDLEKFTPLGGTSAVQNSKLKAKKKLGWEKKFVVLFVGRLVPEKGVPELLEAAKKWDKNITLTIAGSGPLEEKINHQSLTINHLIFLGKISQEKLPLYYSAADLLIVPSTHEEGFGRVILESLACGTPVIGSNRGAIPEAMDETVGKLIDVTPENIKDAVEYFYKNPKELARLSKNARKFAEKRYSERNVEKIINAYALND